MSVKFRANREDDHMCGQGQHALSVVWDEATGIPNKVFASIHERFSNAVGSLSKPVQVVVVGALAANLHVETPRVTHDADFVLDVRRIPIHRPNQKSAFESGLRRALGSEFAVTEPIGGNSHSAFIVTDTKYKLRGEAECVAVGVPTGIHIDTYYSRPQGNVPLAHIVEFAVHATVSFADTAYGVMIASIPTLVQMKLVSDREKDRIDIKGMIDANYGGSVRNFVSDERTAVEFASLFAKRKGERRGIPVEEVSARLEAIMRS